MHDIAFIGLGNMGAPMAVNLMRAGHAVAAYDLSASVLAAIVEAGASRSSSIGEAVKMADVVITMLPAGAQVRSVYLENGVLAHAKKGALLIDSSTIDVDTAQVVHAAAEYAGFDFLDAPVSGGIVGATGASLSFMCGGTQTAFERAKPILEKMGKRIVLAGAGGAGQAAKICNNMLLAICMIGTAEAFTLGEKLGLDHHKLYEIIAGASGQSWALTSYCPVPGPVPAAPSNRDYRGGFATALMLKDLKLALGAAQKAVATVPLGAEATRLYELFASQGEGELDFSAIIKMLRGA